MAIGSAPEIGYQFTTWGRMTVEHREAWFTYMREQWSPNLYAGEASIIYPDVRLRTKYFNEIMEETSASHL
jgi:hypothetical protein